jgi:hypothetical protein
MRLGSPAVPEFMEGDLSIKLGFTPHPRFREYFEPCWDLYSLYTVVRVDRNIFLNFAVSQN